MPSTEATLLPCPSPWCTKSEPELQQGGFRNGHFRVECQTCFTKGPTRDDLNGGGPAAIAAWNTRPNLNTDKLLREALEEIANLGKQAGQRHEVVMLNVAIDRARAALTRILNTANAG